MKKGARVTSRLPKTHKRSGCYKKQVIFSAPHSQELHLLSEEDNHPGVACKLDYGVRTMHRSAVMGEESTGFSTQPYCTSVFSVMVEEVMLYN